MRKAEIVEQARGSGWYDILAATVSCIGMGMGHCGGCAECIKRKKAGMML